MKKVILSILALMLLTSSAFAYNITIPNDKWDKYKAKILSRYTYPEIACTGEGEEYSCAPIEETQDEFTQRMLFKVIKQQYLGIKKWETENVPVTDDF